jgi:nucleoside 2-deoxyribosyltransferase
MKLLKGVYLAGPMSGFSATEMKGWRDIAHEQIAAADVPVLDPTRRISFHEQCLDDKGLSDNIANRIFRQDLRDIARCEVLLTDMRDHPNAKAQGTAAEVMFSHMKNKIIIMFKNPDDKLNPFMTAMATEVHDSLQSAIDAAIDYSL